MIRTEHLDFTYPKLGPAPGPSPAATPVPQNTLRDVSLEVPPGASLAVMGANGSGKSTLCHVLAGLAPRYTGGQASGVVRVAGADVLTVPPPVGAVGLLFQDAATQLFNATAEDEVAWGLEALSVPAAEITARVEGALARFGLLEARRSPPWALSGGQQKRLALAALWAMQPQALLLDEPLGGLDPQGRREVLATLRALRQARASLLLTTVRPQAARLADAVALLEGGALHDPVPPAQRFEHPQPLVDAGVWLPPARWPALSPARSPAPSGEPALALAGLRFSYEQGPEILHGLDLAIPAGQFVALVGPNGAGKSTLARHFIGLLRPGGGRGNGRVRVMGREIAGRPVGVLARDVGYLFQRPEQQLFAPKVRDEVAFGLRHLPRAEAQARVERALARFDLLAFAELPPSALNYGAQRAVTLAALAARDTPVLVLDEPSVGLDGRGWAQLLGWLAERRAAGVTLVLITHEVALARRADRVLLLEQGHIRADGDPGAVLPLFEPEAAA